jgi:hypothetical protein
MKRVLETAFAVLLLMQMGCGSESTKTYPFTGVWSFSGQKGVCSQPIPGGTIEFSSIYVSVYSDESDIENDKDPIDTVSVPCDEGSFVVEDLERGSYYVVVEAMAEDPVIVPEGDAGVSDTDNADPQTRAYFISSDTVVVPTSGDEPVEFEMKINNGSILVTWDFAEGGSCSSEWNNVAKVDIELTGTKSINDQSSGKIACNTSGKQEFLFDDLDWDVYTVTITGYDSTGAETHTGSFDEPIEIRPGTDITGRDGIIHLAPIEK